MGSACLVLLMISCRLITFRPLLCPTVERNFFTHIMRYCFTCSSVSWSVKCDLFLLQFSSGQNIYDQRSVFMLEFYSDRGYEEFSELWFVMFTKCPVVWRHFASLRASLEWTRNPSALEVLVATRWEKLFLMIIKNEWRRDCFTADIFVQSTIYCGLRWFVCERIVADNKPYNSATHTS